MRKRTSAQHASGSLQRTARNRSPTRLNFDRWTSRSEVFEIWQALAPLIGGKLIATTPTAHQTAAMLRLGGMHYFDSLITSLAQERKAIVITRDPEIAKRVET
jgi:hypothetical protein